MKRKGAAQGSEGGKFSVPNPTWYTTIMSATILSPLRGSDVLSFINSKGGLMPRYRPLCPLRRHGVLCVKKHI
jgi:hypothetical protein